MLSEISQSQKHKYCMILLHEVSKVVKLIKTESIMVVWQAWRGREKETGWLICV